MSIKKVHGEQPKEFKFSTENLKKVEEILKRYPDKNKKSAVMPLLYLAQRQNENWIPLAAMKYIANYLAMPYISVYEVATFYSMYNLAPVGSRSTFQEGDRSKSPIVDVVMLCNEMVCAANFACGMSRFSLWNAGHLRVGSATARPPTTRPWGQKKVNHFHSKLYN